MPLGPCAFRDLDNDVLLTTPFGDWTFIREEILREVLRSGYDPANSDHTTLSRGSFLRDQVQEAEAMRRLQRRWHLALTGPSLHTFFLNSTRDRDRDADATMTGQRLERALDISFMSTAPRLHLVFREQDAFSQLEMLTGAVTYVADKNRLAQKDVSLCLMAPWSTLTGAGVQWAIENEVALVPMIPLADTVTQRTEIARIIGDYHNALKERWGDLGGRRARISVRWDQDTAAQKPQLAQFCDEIGCREISLPLPLESAQADPATSENGFHLYLNTYLNLLDGLLDMACTEPTAEALACKVLNLPSTNAQHISPGSEGLGQLAYTPDGGIFVSADAVSLRPHADDIFRVGTVGQTGYHDLMTHPTLRALVLATTVQGQPGIAHHAYAPFFNVSAVRNYAAHLSIQGRPGQSREIQWQTAILDHLFVRLKVGGASTQADLTQWVQG